MKVKCFLPFQRFLELDELLVEEHEYVRSCAENSKGSSGKLFLSFGVKTLSSGSSGIIMLSCMLLLLIIKAGSTQTPDIGKETTKTDGITPMPSNTDPAAMCKDISIPHVRISSLSASWSYEKEKMILENITFEVDQVCKQFNSKSN